MSSDPHKAVIIYTDGACLGNPGPGGYGVVVLAGSHRKELFGGFRVTTNNRMEILAAIIGLEALKHSCKVTLYSDSAYLVNAVRSGAALRWRQNHWRRDRGKMVKNPDLWECLLNVCERHDASFVWVKGHANVKENERCDELSVTAAKGSALGIDDIFEQENPGLHVRSNPPSPTAESTQKITKEGQPCRKCGEPVVKRRPRRKHGSQYYYEYYLYCPQCRTMYMVDEAKRYS